MNVLIEELGERGISIIPKDDRVEVLCRDCGAVYDCGRPIQSDSADITFDNVEIEGIECPKCHCKSLDIKVYLGLLMFVPGDPEENNYETDDENVVVEEDSDGEDTENDDNITEQNNEEEN